MNDPTEEKIAEITQEIADAKHMSKPNAKNMQTVYDADGCRLFEIYDAKHMSKSNAKNMKNVYDANGRWLFKIYMVDHKIK